MKNVGRFALAAGAMALSGQAAFGELAYDVNNAAVPPAGFTQQNGNNAAYYGDTVDLGVPAKVLNSVNIWFGFFTYDPALYTPDIQIDLFNVDANGIPVDSNPLDTLSYTPFATAHNNTTVFTGSNYNGGGSTFSTRQNVVVDFSSQAIVLPQKFAFGFRDVNPAGLVSPGSGFSIYIPQAFPTIGAEGITGGGLLVASPNDLTATTFGVQFAGDRNVEAEIDVVPEPASIGLLALGAGALMRRRRGMR